jgi:hypothetical protein
MTQQEFEARIGTPVSPDVFETANRAYMACGDSMDKDTFCELWKTEIRGNFQLVSILTAQVEHFSHLASLALEAKEDLARLAADKAYDHDDDELRRAAIEYLGKREYIKHILSQGADLSSDDRDLVLELL